ncbi:MAG TPA: chromate resistance protein ChrB domain-containing protein [Polyangiales bacterium]
MSAASQEVTGRWLLLIHQLPPRPNYLRVKIGRHLARLGAVALKNTVYVLPRSDDAQEDFQWVLREILAAGGEATLLTAQLVDGLSDLEVERLFRAARDADYAELAQEARALGKRLARGKPTELRRRELEPEVQRLERRLDEVARVDFFAAAGREAVLGLVVDLRARVSEPVTPPPKRGRGDERNAYRGRTWVTRVDIHVDRIASAWLIRRFVDDKARFKLVPAKGYVPEAGELRFDMFEAEFSHEGDLCTFEVLCARLQLVAPGLRALAEIVHDIDLKDGKFARPETAGVAALLHGLVLAHPVDDARLARGSELFDELLAHFGSKRG